MLIPVILSGGSGTRLWPLSRELYPKQLMPLVAERSMLQETVARTDGLSGIAPPIVVCNENHRFMVAEQLRELDVTPQAIVLEPLGSHNLLTVRCGEDTLKVSVQPDLFPTANSDVWLRLEPARIRWMDRDTGTAIHTGAEELATETAVVIS